MVLARFIQYLVIIYQKIDSLYVRIALKKNDPRVFCIAFSKNGTTSLDKALTILGYRNVHWLRAHREPSNGWIDYIKKIPV